MKLESGADPSRKVVIHLIGDSTMAVRPANPVPPSVGWGQVLDQYFDDGVVIKNHARSGRSSKSFVDEGLWAPVHDQLAAGDYLIIQFGRNDQKASRPDLYADPHGAYKDYLRRFVEEARDKGAEPILATPLARRRFDKQGRFRDDMGDYPIVVRELAGEMQTPLLDLHRGSQALLSSLGPEASKALVWWLEPGIDPAQPDGRQDNSHLSEAGARQVCRLAAAELRDENSPLARHLTDVDSRA
jgi:lysophospholipase L1-like esterase